MYIYLLLFRICDYGCDCCRLLNDARLRVKVVVLGDDIRDDELRGRLCFEGHIVLNKNSYYHDHVNDNDYG